MEVGGKKYKLFNILFIWTIDLEPDKELEIYQQDYEKAFEWYKKAADQGNQEASNRIGKLVIDGKIDNKDIVIYSTEDTGLTLGDIEK